MHTTAEHHWRTLKMFDLHRIYKISRKFIMIVLRNSRFVPFVAIATACTLLIRFDSTSIEKLKELRTNVTILYEEMNETISDEDRIDEVRSQIRDFYLYEKSKGILNAISIDYAESIQLIFERHVAYWQDNGWNDQSFELSKLEIQRYFDRALKSEEYKPGAVE